MTTLNSSDEHPNRKSQLLISIASTPSAPAAPESFDETHVTSSYMKSRGTVSGTSHTFQRMHTRVFPQGGHACPDAYPVEPLQPVARFFCISHPGGDTINPPCRLSNRRPAKTYLTTLCSSSSGLPPHPPPPRHWRPLPPRIHLPGPHGDLSNRYPSAW